MHFCYQSAWFCALNSSFCEINWRKMICEPGTTLSRVNRQAQRTTILRAKCQSPSATHDAVESAAICNSRVTPVFEKFRATWAVSLGEVRPHNVKANHISVIVYTTIRIYDLSYIRQFVYMIYRIYDNSYIWFIVYTTIRIYDLSYIRKNKYVKCIVTLDTHIVKHSYTNLGIMNLVANEHKEPVEPTNVAKAANAI